VAGAPRGTAAEGASASLSAALRPETPMSGGGGRGQRQRAAQRGQKTLFASFASPPSSSSSSSAARVPSQIAAGGSEGLVTVVSKLVGRSFHAAGAEALLELARGAGGGEGGADATSARVELVVEREPQNRFDANALLVKCRAPSSELLSCGHIPREHARVLSPLIHSGAVTLAAAVDAQEVVELAGNPKPPSLHLRAALCATLSPDAAAATQDALRGLASAAEAAAVAVQTKVGPKALDVQRSAAGAKRQASQRSLLVNFGGNLEAAAGAREGSARARRRLGAFIVSAGLFPQVAVHLGVRSAAQARAASREWRGAVEELRHMAFRPLVEGFVGGHGWDVARMHQHWPSGGDVKVRATREMRPREDGECISAVHCTSIRIAVRLVMAWAPAGQPLLLQVVVDAGGSAMPVGVLRRLATDLELGEADGWALLAAALLATTSMGRLSLARQIVGARIMQLDGLRELVSLLVATCFCHLEACRRGRFWGLTSSDGSEQGGADRGRVCPPLLAARRLRADLLAVNRLLEDAGLKIPIRGLHMPGIQLTEEQVAIVARDVSPSELLVISAFAGTGKTSTLRMYASLRPHLKILYICFNVSVREEAQRTFPENVTCKNAHQLAFRACGFKYTAKFKDNLKAEDLLSCSVLDALDAPSPGSAPSSRFDTRRFELAEALLATLQAFLNSAAKDVSEDHLPRPLPSILRGDGASTSALCDATRQLWTRMKDRFDTDVPITHDGYLKLFSLSKPQLAFDVVLLDEAQDCNPAIADIVASQSCARILVGDKHQAIYGFLGAQDALKDASSSTGVTRNEGTTVFKRQLTRSFRFGPNIADVANFILGHFKQEPRPVIGCGLQEGSLLPDLLPDPHGVHETNMNDSPLEGCPRPPFAYIARTNAAVIAMALNAQAARLEVAWVGGVKGYRLDLLRDLCLLANGQGQQAENKRVRAFGSLEALRGFAKRVDDRELVARIDLVRRCEPQELLGRLDRLREAADRREAGAQKRRGSAFAAAAAVHLATVHKAKGLEWDTVLVADDFASPDDLGRSAGFESEQNQEANAFYVAVTRAKKFLQLPGPWAEAYARSSESLSFVEAPSPSSAEGGSTAARSPCPWCGIAILPSRESGILSWARSKAEGSRLVAVGSVSLRRLCEGCALSACACPLGAAGGGSSSDLTGGIEVFAAQQAGTAPGTAVAATPARAVSAAPPATSAVPQLSRRPDALGGGPLTMVVIDVDD